MSAELIMQLPEFWRKSAPLCELERVLGAAAAAAEADKEFTLRQLWPQTATGWGLELWERAYGIEPEAAKDEDYRRTRLTAKLRGQGTATVQLIQAVAQSFTNGEVEIAEYNGEARFVVKFTSRYGVPPNIEDLTAAIRDIKPAHLDFVYEYLFRQWGAVKTRIWGELKNNTWQQVREGDLA
ncbi:MAG: putative phage tail protein [Candidatus Heteroscillospira sp.]